MHWSTSGVSFPHYITDEILNFVMMEFNTVENSNAYLWKAFRRLESMHEPWLSCFMVKYRILYKLDICMVYKDEENSIVTYFLGNE